MSKINQKNNKEDLCTTDRRDFHSVSVSYDIHGKASCSMFRFFMPRTIHTAAPRFKKTSVPSSIVLFEKRKNGV